MKKLWIGLIAILLLAASPLYASTLDTELLDKYKQGWSQLNQWNLFDAAAVDILALEAGSLGSDGHWTNTGSAITLDAAPTKFIATYSSGQLLVTILDTDDITGTTYDQTVDFGTNNKVIFGDNSDTFTIEFDAADTILQSSDGAIVFKSSQADGEVHFKVENDSDDYLAIQTNSNVPTIATLGSSNLAIVPDGGTTAITGILTVSSTASITGATTLTSLIIGDDTYDVVVDDEHRFTSNDTDVVVESYGTTDKDALFQLTSDASADNGDEWQVKNDDADSNNLLFINDTGGSLATVMTLATTGLLTTTNDIYVVNDTSATNVVQDLLRLTSSSTGTPAAGLGAGLVVRIDDAGGVEEQASIDFTLTDVTTASENCDIIVSANTEGTIREVFKIDTDSTATDNTLFTLTSWTIETNGVRDMLELVLDNTADTAVDNFGLGISIVLEDETNTAEQQASLDFVLTDAGSTTEDCDIVFSQNLAGTITETLRLDVDSGMTYASAVASQPLFWLENTKDDTTCPIIKLEKDRATEADGDDLGRISFYGSDDADGASEFVYILAEAADVSDSKESGSIEISLEIDDTDTSMVKMFGDTGTGTTGHIEFNMDSADIDFHIDGDTTADLFHIDAGTEVITLGGVTIAASGLKTAVVAVTDAATYTVLAANSGKLHYIPDLTADCVLTLPTAASGLNYEFVYGGAAEDVQDWMFDTGADANYYIGGCTDFDDDDGTLGVVYSDGNSNSKVSILTPNAGTLIKLWCDGTHWIINGQVVSGTDTATVFADQV